MIYLDSAATSFQKPPQVLRAAEKALREASSPGRGGYGAAMRAAELMLDAREEAAAFFKYLDGPEAKHRDTFAIPGVLDEAIEAQGCRYGLLLIARGMTRDIKGYRKDVAKSVFLGIATTLLTLGTVTMYSTPKKASSELFALVLDAETNRVVFYNTNGPQSTDPLQANPVSGQLSGLLKDYMK